MTIQYALSPNDILAFHLFSASRNDRINRKKRKGRVLLTAGSVAVALYFYWKQNIPLTVYFGLVALACGLFYPKYFIWRYKRHYITHIKEIYSKRFGQTETIEINDDCILSKDKTGEGRINLSEITQIDETDDHFFMKISTGLALIIPKRDLQQVDQLRARLIGLGLPPNDETNWKWR